MSRCRIIVNRHGTLTLRLYWRGRESWESTGLKDTPAHRRQVTAFAALITTELQAGAFTTDRYLHYFPNGSRIAELRAATAPQSAPMPQTLSEYIAEWLARHVPPAVRTTRARSLAQHCRAYIVPQLGRLRIDQVDRRAVQEFKTWLLTVRRVSTKTARNICVDTLKRILTDATAEALRSGANPAHELGWPKRRTRTVPDPLTMAERDAVLGYLRERKTAWYPYVATLLWTGMRPSEAAGLHWGDVDLRAGTVTIRRSRVRGEESSTKTAGSERTIRMARALTATLRAIQPLHAAPDAPVYLGPTGRRIEQQRVQERVWAPALRALGIRPRGLKHARHTFICIALQTEAPQWVKEYVGHLTLAMIDRHYGKWLPLPGDDDPIERATGGENRDPRPGSRVSRRFSRVKLRVSEGARTHHSPLRLPPGCRIIPFVNSRTWEVEHVRRGRIRTGA